MPELIPRTLRAAMLILAFILLTLRLQTSAGSTIDSEEMPDDPHLRHDHSAAFEPYMTERARSFGLHSSGSGADRLDGTEAEFYEMHGSRILRPGIELVQICGIIVDQDPDEVLRNALADACEARFLQHIKRFTQPTEHGAYRAAGASEISWQHRFVTLINNDMALILEGRYGDPAAPAPCIRVAGCCNVEGLSYLDSCHGPDEDQWRAIRNCQQFGLKNKIAGDPEWDDCLREQGVKIGCEPQADGSRLCY